MSADEQVKGLRGRSDVGPRYQFKDGIWDVIAEVMHWPSVTAAAKALGVSDTTLSRAIKGETAPGEVLMARLMSVLPRTWKHEHVFELSGEEMPSFQPSGPKSPRPSATSDAKAGAPANVDSPQTRRVAAERRSA